MAKLKTENKWEWLVPMKLTFRSVEVLVKAETANEARQKASRGDWNEQVTEGELSDWEVTGNPEQNS